MASSEGESFSKLKIDQKYRCNVVLHRIDVSDYVAAVPSTSSVSTDEIIEGSQENVNRKLHSEAAGHLSQSIEPHSILISSDDSNSFDVTPAPAIVETAVNTTDSNGGSVETSPLAESTHISSTLDASNNLVAPGAATPDVVQPSVNITAGTSSSTNEVKNTDDPCKKRCRENEYDHHLNAKRLRTDMQDSPTFERLTVCLSCGEYIRANHAETDYCFEDHMCDTDSNPRDPSKLSACIHMLINVLTSWTTQSAMRVYAPPVSLVSAVPPPPPPKHFGPPKGLVKGTERISNASLLDGIRETLNRFKENSKQSATSGTQQVTKSTQSISNASLLDGIRKNLNRFEENSESTHSLNKRPISGDADMLHEILQKRRRNIASDDEDGEDEDSDKDHSNV